MTETADKRKGRAPNGASTIYKGREGSWHGRVTMGVRDDGRPDRRHVEAKTRAAATRKVRELERQRAAGTAGKPGRAWTVGQWLTHWVETIAAPIVRDNTLAGYRVAVRVHLVPAVGAHRLDRLEPEHLERLRGPPPWRGGRGLLDDDEEDRSFRGGLGDDRSCRHRGRPGVRLAVQLRLELRRSTGSWRSAIELPGVVPGRGAEDARFELARGCPQHAFQACALGH
jgi:integrase